MKQEQAIQISVRGQCRSFQVLASIQCRFRHYYVLQAPFFVCAHALSGLAGAPATNNERCTSWFKPKFRQLRMLHAIDTRMSHIWYPADRHEQWKRVTWPVFLLRTQDWRQHRKCVPTNHRPSKRSIIDGHLLQEDQPLPGAPRHVCTKFRAKIRRTAQDQY